jgi:hypothetical protein
VETPKKLEGENLKINFDLTKSELEYIIDNANFNDIQERVFRRLTSKEGRQSIVKISLEENLSTATVSRIIKKIKKKIYKVI